MKASTLTSFTAGAVMGGLSAAAAYGSVSKSSQLFGPTVYRGSGQTRTIALTFDDGPSEGTLPLLEYLSNENVFATFFQCGKNVWRRPDIAGEVAAAGHQLGNHSYSHPNLVLKSANFIDREFTEAQKIISFETGLVPMVLRPPYGFRWAGLSAVQQKLSLLNVLWTVIGNDWRWPAERIQRHVLKRATPGGIICLHDGRETQRDPDISETLKALRTIVPALKDQGYEFLVISDLLQT
jgi:peptidoglycan-N-acetylglucosamine deacetylase